MFLLRSKSLFATQLQSVHFHSSIPIQALQSPNQPNHARISHVLPLPTSTHHQPIIFFKCTVSNTFCVASTLSTACSAFSAPPLPPPNAAFPLVISLALSTCVSSSAQPVILTQDLVSGIPAVLVSRCLNYGSGCGRDSQVGAIKIRRRSFLFFAGCMAGRTI